MIQFQKSLQEVAKMVMPSKQSNLADTRGIGKPSNFKGDEGKYPEWKAKLNAYIRSSDRKAYDWVIKLCEHHEPITSIDYDDLAVDEEGLQEKIM